MVCAAHIGVYRGIVNAFVPFDPMLASCLVFQILSPHSLVLLQEQLATKHVCQCAFLVLPLAGMDLGHSVYFRLHYHKVLDDLGRANLPILGMVHRRHHPD